MKKGRRPKIGTAGSAATRRKKDGKNMNREEIFTWVKAAYGTEPDYPWQDENAVLRHKDNNKWYGVILTVAEKKLGMSGDRMVDVLNVKCDPLLIGSLRQQEGYFPAYHMNKEKWISMLLDGTVAAEEIKNLIDLSYRLTKSKPSGRRRR